MLKLTRSEFVHFVEIIKSLGTNIALDYFGTGYSYCDTVQGYFYSNPDKFENVVVLLQK